MTEGNPRRVDKGVCGGVEPLNEDGVTLKGVVTLVGG